MDFKRELRILVGFLCVTMAAAAAFAEDAPAVATDTTAPVSISQSSMPPAALEKEGEAQWVWGEVVSLDAQAKAITLKYLDYETDQEKELTLLVDDRTSFENVKNLDEIKAKDTLSVDYVSEPENKNIAKNISLEKTDGAAAPVQEDAAKPVSDTAQVTEQAAVSTEQPKIPAETENTVAATAAPVLTETPAAEATAPETATTTDTAAPETSTATTESAPADASSQAQ